MNEFLLDPIITTQSTRGLRFDDVVAAARAQAAEYRRMNDINVLANGGPIKRRHVNEWKAAMNRKFPWLELGSNEAGYDYERYYNENYDEAWSRLDKDAYHFPDKYKLETHKTFSNDSMFSKSENHGGRWTNEDTFIPSTVNLQVHPEIYKERKPYTENEIYDQQYAQGGGLSRSKDYGSKKKPYPSVKSGDFAGGGRSYPIPTKADAVDALRLAGLHHRADVKAKVYKKYPSLKHAEGGLLEFPDWDPTHPYHLHTNGKKVVFTPEAYANLTSNLKQQVDEHRTAMDTFENKYQVNPEYTQFLQKVADTNIANNVRKSLEEGYLDKEWYDKNWKSGAYTFDDNGILNYNGQTYAPFGDYSSEENRKRAITVPLRNTSGSSYGYNAVYYPYNVPQQYVEKVPDNIDVTVNEYSVNEVKAKAKENYVKNNMKLKYKISPRLVTGGWETDFGEDNYKKGKYSVLDTYKDYYGDNPTTAFNDDRNKVIKAMIDSGKPMYSYMRKPNFNGNNFTVAYFEENKYIPDLYFDYTTANNAREAYKKELIKFAENKIKEAENWNYVSEDEKKRAILSYKSRIDDINNNNFDFLKLLPVTTKPSEEEVERNVQIGIGDLIYKGSEKYAEGGLLDYDRPILLDQSPVTTVPDNPNVNLDLMWKNNQSIGNNRKMNMSNMEQIDNYLVSKNVPLYQRQAILYTILQESGADALDAHGNGYYGLVGWSADRYNSIKDKSLLGQAEYLYDTLYNGDGSVDWNHGGIGSGYNSWKDARKAFVDAQDFDTAMRALTYGYVRPAADVKAYRLQYGSKHF